MNYLLNRNKRAGRNSLSRFAVLLFAALFLVVFIVWYPVALRSALGALSAPLWRAGNKLGSRTAALAAHLRFKQSLIRELEELRRREQENKAVLSAYEMVLEENQRIKQILGMEEKEKRILAAVLVSPPRAPYDTIILDAGIEDGVSAGDDIVWGETVLGRIAIVSKKTATAELFSTASLKTPIVIWHGGIAVPAEAVGKGNGAFRVTLPKEVEIAVGDIVVMPGVNPKQFANVVAVEAGDTDSFATAYLRNPVRPELLPYLQIRAR